MINKKTIASKLLALALVFAIIEIADAATPEAKETKPQTNQEKKIQEKKQEKKQERKLAKTSAKLIAAKPLFESKVLSAMIDAEISKKIKEEKVTPSAKSTDAEFQRRAYLDIIGRIPTSSETKSFLENNTPDKRVKLVDDLLADDAFGKHQPFCPRNHSVNSASAIRPSSSALPLMAAAMPIRRSSCRSELSRTPPEACQRTEGKRRMASV